MQNQTNEDENKNDENSQSIFKEKIYSIEKEIKEIKTILKKK